jgi:DNA-binding response OmpR family regulator
MDRSLFASRGNACQQMTAGDLVLDMDTREVRRDGRKICLELREFQLLEYLLRNKDQIVPREEILREIWGKDILNHTLDARMSALRKKIEHDFPVKMLYTISGKGYLLVDHL